MHKNSWIIVSVVFVIFFGLFTRSQVPIAITQSKVLLAINDAIAETKAQVDETEVEQVVNKAIEKLEADQQKRLKYLVSAYFVIWLIFILYALRLSQNQTQLRKRLDQLEGKE